MANASAAGSLGDDLQRLRGVDAISELRLIAMDLGVSRLRMKDKISLLKTWPGTSTGKPGGYGVTNVAETTDSPVSIFSSTSSAGRYSHMVWS